MKVKPHVISERVSQQLLISECMVLFLLIVLLI